MTNGISTTRGKLRVYTVTVTGESLAAKVAARIVLASQWFAMTPMPDEDYEFTVKLENGSFLHELITEAETG